MAGDWIKLETCTLEKPEIFALAEYLKCQHEIAVVACVRLWIWSNQQSRNGHALSVTKTTLDSVSRIVGFADAMQKVGWLIDKNGVLSIPNFDRHNGKSAKERALSTKRKVTQRSRSDRDITVTREEKRRDINTPVQIAPEFEAFWRIYPKKKAKLDAIKSWQRLKPDSSLVDRILKTVSAEQWPEEQFIPYPASWLNARRWEDEAAPPQRPRLSL